MTYSRVLMHKAAYSGGFKQVNGRSNNTAAYNHNYYQQNKSKWKMYGKRHGNGYLDQQESDMFKDLEEQCKKIGSTPEDIFFNQDFDITLMEFGGYDTENMSKEEKDRLRSDYMKRYSIVDDEKSRREHSWTKGNYMTGGMPTSAKKAMTEAMQRKAEKEAPKVNRGNRMGGGMPSKAEQEYKKYLEKKAAKHSDASEGEYYAVTYSAGLKHHGIKGQK